jgi:hypothetical protein
VTATAITTTITTYAPIQLPPLPPPSSSFPKALTIYPFPHATIPKSLGKFPLVIVEDSEDSEYKELAAWDSGRMSPQVNLWISSYAALVLVSFTLRHRQPHLGILYKHILSIVTDFRVFETMTLTRTSSLDFFIEAILFQLFVCPLSFLHTSIQLHNSAQCLLYMQGHPSSSDSHPPGSTHPPMLIHPTT